MRMKVNNTLLLSACVLVLAALCVMSIASPLRHEQQQAVREKAVKSRLVKIRSAEERYLQRHGTYTGSFDELVRSGLLADSLRYIPFTDSLQFRLQASAVDGRGGRQIPLMECSATYSQYLQGLDKDFVADLTEEADAAGRFPGLKIGDLQQPVGNAGNWE